MENIYEANLSDATQGKVRCLFSKASTEESWKWHKALSHLNFKKMNHLIKHNLVRGLSQLNFIQDGLCDACQQGKQRRISFKSKQENSIADPFHLLHLDLFGPVNIMSINKKRFSLVIVDDYTRFTWVFFLNRKDETFQHIQELINVIENSSEFTVKKLRSDNGTEFKNGQMEEYYATKGITQQYSAPGSPQQNGVVERKNRTLIEATRTMLAEAKLPTYFWAEAVNTACFTQNCTLVNMHGKTTL